MIDGGHDVRAELAATRTLFPTWPLGVVAAALAALGLAGLVGGGVLDGEARVEWWLYSLLPLGMSLGVAAYLWWRRRARVTKVTPDR